MGARKTGVNNLSLKAMNPPEEGRRPLAANKILQAVDDTGLDCVEEKKMKEYSWLTRQDPDENNKKKNGEMTSEMRQIG